MRKLSVRWVGPIPYMEALYVQPSGLYLVFAGQHLLYVDGGPSLDKALNAHFGPGMRALDHTGREVWHYARNYRLDPTVKVGVVKDVESDAVVRDSETLADVVSLIIHEMHPPTNPYGREQYEGKQALHVRHYGKFWPLPAEMEGEPAT